MKTYKLKNLDCANCALKIQTELQKLDTVEKVSVNFATCSMNIKTNNMDNVTKKIKDIEPKVEVISNNTIEDKNNDWINVKGELFYLGFVFIIFFIGLRMEGSFFSI